MNGLLGWALQEIGFDVTYQSGGLGRATRGDSALGNHLVLLVKLEDQDWVTDVGFGDGFIEPLLLKNQKLEQRGFLCLWSCSLMAIGNTEITNSEAHLTLISA